MIRNGKYLTQISYLLGAICAVLFIVLTIIMFIFRHNILYQLRIDPSIYHNLILDDHQMARYNRLEDVIRSDNLIQNNQAYNTEFSLFTLFHSVNAMYSMTRTDNSLAERTLSNIEIAIEKAIAANVYRYWYFPGFEHIHSVNTLCYLGRLNLMLARYHELGGEKYQRIANDINNRLIAIFTEQITPISYTGEVWIADNAIALASVYVRDKVDETEFSSRLIEEWMEALDRNYKDDSGLVIASAYNGFVTNEARVTSLGLTIIYTSVFDMSFAREQYDLMKEYYIKTFPVTAFREWKNGIKQIADMDSGPIVLGYSIAASGTALGAAKAVGDFETFDKLARIIEFFSFPYLRNERLGYYIFSPVSDALMGEFYTITLPD